MNNRYKYLIRNTGILTISNFSSKILVFLLVPLYTSILTTSEYGVYDLALSTIQLIYPIFTANIVDGVMRFSMEKGCNEEDVVSVALRFIICSTIFTGLLLIGNYYFKLWNDINGFELLIFLYYVFYMLNQFFIQLSKGLERIRDMAIAGVIGTLAMLGFNLLFFGVIKLGLSGFFIANILGQAIPVVFFVIRFKIWNLIKINNNNNELQHKMLIYSVPLLFSTLGWWVNNASSKYIVTILCGIGVNGLLSVAYKLPSILNTFQSIFVQAWQVSAIKEYGGKDVNDFYKSAFVYLNIVMCVGAAILILLTKPVAYILFANDFYSAWIYVPFLLLSSVFNASAGFIGPILSAQKDTKSMAKSAIYGASINIVLSIFLVYIIGGQGATIAVAVSSFITFYVRKQAIGDMIKSKEYKLVLFSWLILCVEALAEIYITSYLATGICLLIISGVYGKIIIRVAQKILYKILK